jgi:hypothetical protein
VGSLLQDRAHSTPKVRTMKTLVLPENHIRA